MTEHATHFVDPRHVPIALPTRRWRSTCSTTLPIPFITSRLLREADAFVVAPCTANVLAKPNGIADDLLTTTALACTRAARVGAGHERAHTRQLPRATTSASSAFVVADEDILWRWGRGRFGGTRTLEVLGVKQDLANAVMITAGPTVEPIDPVHISNRSSGKTGYAIARAARRRGADVTLITAGFHSAPSDVHVVHVNTALEMLQACEEAFPSADIALFSAAVADMRPALADHKKKRGRCRHHHIGREPGYPCRRRVRCRTDNVIANAQAKLVKKNADVIVANRGAWGFRHRRMTTCASWTPTRSTRRPAWDKLADVILDHALEYLRWVAERRCRVRANFHDSRKKV